MYWEALAVMECKERGLEVVPYGFEGGWVFVKDEKGKVFPIGEDVIAKWINA
ncbi:DUF866 domain-containing protein [Lederbergia galactosidilytica]|uniref:DUF866 domain-containing protein n=1 Tax=Lederbergia galactosidilytica TaxID=217031 RepID=UPI000AF7F450|nr:DUF866 domain-containing protein [Lederbergia galactosidilytica]